MRTSILSAVFATAAFAVFTQGCAAASSSDASESSAAETSMTSDDAVVLADVLAKADAPSNAAPMTAGVGSHVARITLQTASGGKAHFISQSGSVSTVDGDALGNIGDLGLDWTSVRNALVAGGASFTSVDAASGGSLSTLVASVECKQAVAPGSKPSCTVTAITMTDADNATLMSALTNGHAPSTVAALGVNDRAGNITLSTAQGGMAHFISQGATLSTAAGVTLADIGGVNVAWKSLETALLDAGLSWKLVPGTNGASSATIDASVACHAVNAKAVCTVVAR